MNFITGKHLPRRTFLRGIGASISLPFMDAMLPAFAGTPAAPVRMLYVYAPTGMMPKDWYPTTTGTDFEFKRIMKPLEKFRPGRLDSKKYEQLRQAILRRDGWTCQICGARSQLEIHHQRFRSQSGKDAEDNLITLCHDCHSELHSANQYTD